MSRVGKLPIRLPEGVQCSINGNEVCVSGPKGTLTARFPGAISFRIEEGVFFVSNAGSSKFDLSMWGTARSIVKKMFTGASVGFTRDIEMCRHDATLRNDVVCYDLSGQGVKCSSKFLYLKLGKSHKVFFEVPEYVSVDSVQQSSRGRGQASIVRLSCIDDAKLGECCAALISQSPVFPYAIKKGMRGIKYLGQEVLLNRVDTKKSGKGKK